MWRGKQEREKGHDQTQVDIYTFSNGRQVILLAEGRLVNLVALWGHPSL